jgi:eukaryotic-like serine/threonine-protein kinase
MKWNLFMSQNYEQFGKYILLEKLASGGMAEVFLAKSLGASGVNKFLAIKRILPQYSDKQEFIDMFKEEAKIAVNLNHGSVVSIYDFGIERGQFFLVMEYVEGRNLRQILNELKKNVQQFSIEQVAYMMKEVAAGIDHAHRLLDGATGKPFNLVHRDMSPQNIMVSYEGEVKVIDFGIAKGDTQAEQTKTGTLKGKFGYMSPEQADGQSIDSRTDLFSMGIVLWELLAHDRLFTSNSEAAILRKIRECQIPSIRKINPSVPIDLENIVNKALARDKALRYQTAAAFHKDLNRFLNTEYPDFSSHDFSVFVKNAFAEVYAESKRKLVEYAQVSNLEEKGHDTQTLTYAPSNNSQESKATSSIQMQGMPAMPNDSGDEKLNIETETKIKVDLSNLKDDQGQTFIRRNNTPSPNSNQKTTVTTTHRNIGASATRTTTNIQKKSSIDPVASLFVVAIIGVGGFLLWKNQQSIKNVYTKTVTSITSNNNSNTKKTELTSDTEEQTDLAATSLVTVTVTSEPLGAEVFINGKPTNLVTPAQVQIPSNKDVVLKLQKMGYLAYENTIYSTENGKTFKTTLLSGKSGALNLAIVNGGAQPVIEINGMKINDTLPLKNYRIPAGLPVVIQVSNPFLGLKTQQTIIVEENESKSLELILKPEKKSP